MAKHYVGDYGVRITVGCNATVTGASLKTMVVTKPDGSRDEYTATIYGNSSIRYVNQQGDWNMAGVYSVQASVTVGSFVGLGDTTQFTVYRKMD